jgi:hypothetical protein
MSKTTELIWLANALIFTGCMGLGWTLVGLVQRTQKAEARPMKKE